MNIKFAQAIATVISALFPGGITEFNKKGQITILPFPSRDVVVYHPDLPIEIKTRLALLENQANAKASTLENEKDRAMVMNKIRYMSTPNFANMDGTALRQNDMGLIKFFNKIEPTASLTLESKSNLVIVSIPTIKDKDDESLPLICEHLKNLDGMVLGYVITKVSVHRIQPNPNRRMKSKMVTSAPVGDRAITQDDITNLIIDIERAKSVDDIINGV